MNDIVKRPEGAVALPGDQNPFTQFAEANRSTAIIGKLLKFSKGDWTCGEANDVVEEGTQFVANMNNLLIGYQRWWQNRPTDQAMGTIVSGFKEPRRADLGEMDESQWEVDDNGQPRDPWQKTRYILLRGIDDEELYTFSTSSKGGIDEVTKLVELYGKMMRQKPDQFPVIEIGTSSYLHSNKAFGRIKTPVLKVVGWVPQSLFGGAPAEESGEDEPAKEAAPAPKTTAKKPAESKAAPKPAAKGKTRF